MSDDAWPPTIQVLSILEAVRKRPHMYFGPDPMRHADAVLATVVLDHLQVARDQPISILVEVLDDWTFRTSDDGPGIPPLIKSGSNESDPASDLVIGRPRQGQLAVCQAMAESMTVTSTHDGRKWQRTYGRDPTAWTDLGPSIESGTSVQVHLDRALLANGLSHPVPVVSDLVHTFGDWAAEWAVPLLEAATIRFWDARSPQ